jgi:hypothetical protein
VLDFPRVEVTPEENARRVTVEATRLASLAPGEWRLWIDRSAERLRIPRATLQGLIVAIIKDSEKKARDAETAARRQELAVRREQERKQREQERIDRRAEHKRKEKEKAFESLISLPSEQQETRLGELAKRLDDDVAVIRDHFTAFVGMQGRAASTDSWNVELWRDPVETQALLQKISAKISKYVVLRPEAAIATALWTTTAWAHEGDALPYSGRNFCRTRFRQEHPPWCSRCAGMHQHDPHHALGGQQRPNDRRRAHTPVGWRSLPLWSLPDQRSSHRPEQPRVRRLAANAKRSAGRTGHRRGHGFGAPSRFFPGRDHTNARQ